MAASEELSQFTSSIFELQKIQSLLSSKLQQLKVFAKLRSEDGDCNGLQGDELQEYVKEMKKKLQDEMVINSNKKEVIKLLVYGQEAFKAVHSEHAPTEGIEARELQSSISDKLLEVAELSRRLSAKLSLMDSFETNVEASKKKLQQLEWKNRDLSALVQHSEQTTDSEIQINKLRETNSKLNESHENREKAMKELVLRRETFRALIQASKTDWFSDPDLLQQVVALGEPIHL